MDSGANGLQEESLVIVSHPGRRLPQSYYGLILSRWLKSLRRHNPTFGRIDQEAYFKNYEAFLKDLIAKPTVTIRLLVLESDPDIVFGWCVHEEGKILHYVHIQEPYRGQKRSYDLIPPGIEYVTHETKHWIKRLLPKYPQVKFNPFL